MLKFWGFLLILTTIVLGLLLASLENIEHIQLGDCLEMRFSSELIAYGTVINVRKIDQDKVISVTYNKSVLEFKESEILYTYKDKFKTVDGGFCKGLL